MYEYKGKQFTSLNCLSAYIGINVSTLRGYITLSEGDSVTFEQLIDERLVKVERIQKEFQEAQELISLITTEEFKNISQIKKYLADNYNVIVYNENLTFLTYLKVICYAERYNYKWLVAKEHEISSIHYDGNIFKNLKRFYNAYSIQKCTLFNAIVECNGDLEAVLSNPSYKTGSYHAHVKPIIKGVSYPSVLQASKELSFNAELYRLKLKEGYSFDEAYEYCKYSMKKRSRVQQAGLPCTIDGVYFEDIKSFAEYYSISPMTVYKKLRESYTLLQIVEEIKQSKLKRRTTVS